MNIVKKIYISWKNTICEVINSENTSIISPLKRLKYLEMNQSNIFRSWKVKILISKLSLSRVLNSILGLWLVLSYLFNKFLHFGTYYLEMTKL